MFKVDVQCIIVILRMFYKCKDTKKNKNILSVPKIFVILHPISRAKTTKN